MSNYKSALKELITVAERMCTINKPPVYVMNSDDPSKINWVLCEDERDGSLAWERPDNIPSNFKILTGNHREKERWVKDNLGYHVRVGGVKLTTQNYKQFI